MRKRDAWRAVYVRWGVVIGLLVAIGSISLAALSQRALQFDSFLEVGAGLPGDDVADYSTDPIDFPAVAPVLARAVDETLADEASERPGVIDLPSANPPAPGAPPDVTEMPTITRLPPTIAATNPGAAVTATVGTLPSSVAPPTGTALPLDELPEAVDELLDATPPDDLPTLTVPDKPDVEGPEPVPGGGIDGLAPGKGLVDLPPDIPPRDEPRTERDGPPSSGPPADGGPDD